MFRFFLLFTLILSSCLFDSKSNKNSVKQPLPEENPKDSIPKGVDTTSNPDTLKPLVKSRFQLLLDTLVPILEANRQLKFKRNIVPVFLSNEEGAKKQNEDLTQDEITSYKYFSKELYHLGFVKDSTYNFLESYYDISESGVAGFYIAGSDTLYVMGDTANISEENWLEFRSTAYHELVHGLQDQALNALGDSITSDVHNAEDITDFYLGQRFVIEGDAEYNQMIFDGEEDDIPFYKDFALNLGLYIRETSIPYDEFYLAYIFGSPYFIGPYYIQQKLGSSKNWAAINSKFYDTKLTSAEIITGNPVNYQGFPSSEIDFIFKKQKYNYRDNSNLGVIPIFTLLKSSLSTSQTKSALGWNGDHLFYYIDTLEQRPYFLWCFSFNNSISSNSFFNLLNQHILERENWSMDSYENNNSNIIQMRSYENVDQESSLIQVGTQVYWMQNMRAQENEILDILTRPISLAKKANQKHISPKNSKWSKVPYVMGYPLPRW